MALQSFFFPVAPDAVPESPPYEVEGPLDQGDPVHENLTLLVLRQALEGLVSGNPTYQRGPLLKGIELASLPAWDSKKQHDFEPKDAPELTQEFLRGVYWPDDPKCLFFKTIRGVKKYTSGRDWFGEFKKGKKGKNKTPAELIARSHFGDLQFLHAMACASGEPAEETKKKILFWARLNIEVAAGRLDPRTLIKNLPEHDGLSMKRFFSAHWDWSFQQLLAGVKAGAEQLSAEDVRRRAAGVLLHLIQDSYAAGHVQRNEAGAVLQFHDYGHQEPHRHGSKDKMGPGKNLRQHIENTPGAMQAIEAGATVIMYLDSKAETQEIVEYLNQRVFGLASNVQPAGPGAEFGAQHPVKRRGLGKWSVQTSPTAFPGSWRTALNPEVGPIIAGMIDKMRRSDAAGTVILGDTAESLFTRAILNNRHVTNEMIIKMSKVTLGPAGTKKEIAKQKLWLVANSAEDIKLAEKLIPDAREWPVHGFTVSLMYAATSVDKKTEVSPGVDEKELSRIFPDLGMVGHQSIKLPFKKRFFLASKDPRVQRSTALHDFTDYLSSSGVEGLNKAVWRIEGRVLSALNSVTPGFDRY